MPSFDLYKKRLGNPRTNGHAHKIESDQVMEATWYNDISAKTAFFYDQNHDEEFNIKDDLHPERTHKIPIEVKLFEIEYNSLSKDEQGFHLQFKPSFEYKNVIPYYDEEFVDKYSAHFPVGLYLDYPDEKGIYHRWLCVGQYRQFANQFPTWIVLPCDFKIQWIFKNQRYESWGVLRSQSSYNSGVWTDYKITSVENQKIIWLPMNEITKKIFYNQRVAISQYREEPIVWKCSKVEDMNVKGITRYTFAQDLWNAHTDYIEKDEDENVIGMWCDYYDNGEVLPLVPIEIPTTVYSVLSYSGLKPEMRIGGSYKKFSVTFYDDDEIIDFRNGVWTFTIDGIDVSSLITTLDSSQSTDVDVNQIKAKINASAEYIGKVLVVGFESNDGIKSELEINLLGT